RRTISLQIDRQLDGRIDEWMDGWMDDETAARLAVCADGQRGWINSVGWPRRISGHERAPAIRRMREATTRATNLRHETACSTSLHATARCSRASQWGIQLLVLCSTANDRD